MNDSYLVEAFLEAASVERAERADSQPACVEALSEAEAVVEAEPGAFPPQLGKTLEAARSATWPRYTRRLLAEARRQAESGEKASSSVCSSAVPSKT